MKLSNPKNVFFYFVFSMLLLTTTAHANAPTIPLPKSPKLGNPYVIAGGLAFNAFMAGVSWVMDEGSKVRDKPKDEAGENAGAGTSSGSQQGSYPYEYVIDHKSFASVEAAHQHILTTVLARNGLKRSRRADGLYYDKVNIYYGYHYDSFSGRFKNSNIGYFVSEVQAVSAERFNSLTAQGNIIRFEGDIYKKGTLSEKEIHGSDKDKAEAAKAQAAANSNDVNAKDIDDAINALRENAKAKAEQYAKEAEAKAKADAEAGAKADSKSDEKTDTDKKDKAKPRETDLPGFCMWAKFICDDSLDKEKDTTIAINDNKDLNFTTLAERKYVVLPKTCPSNPKISVALPFVTGNNDLEFPLHLFCQSFALFKPIILLFAYIRALVIIGQGF